LSKPPLPVSKLSSRHLQFIALGGAIGSGLFLGTADGIHTAGPALLVAYALTGLIVFLIARALGQMTLEAPRGGSFAAYADEYLGPCFGFITGWAYWLGGLIAGMTELTAVGLLMHFWFPSLPQWIPALAMLALLYTVNRLGARVFGETEFWFTLIKILTILALIAIGLVLLLIGYRGGEIDASIANLWRYDGLFPAGWGGFIAVLPIAFFAFGGIEMIGLAAAEAEAPQRTLPKAINGMILRILIFYIGAVAVILSLFPWPRVAPDTSPFVALFDQIGIPAAAGLVNFVVITALLSSCNSNLFASGRLLRAIAQRGQAPAWLSRLDRRGVPAQAVRLALGLQLGAVFINYLFPTQAFHLLVISAAVPLLWAWLMIVVAHLCRRGNDVAIASLRMPWAPVSNYAVILFIVAVLALMIGDEHLRPPTLLGVAGLGGLAAIYAVFIRGDGLAREQA
jgi:amino acid transporter, AAT family